LEEKKMKIRKGGQPIILARKETLEEGRGFVVEEAGAREHCLKLGRGGKMVCDIRPRGFRKNQSLRPLRRNCRAGQR